jgi:hypothetical protein
MFAAAKLICERLADRLEEVLLLAVIDDAMT